MTDPLLPGERGVVETVRQALAAGVLTVQLRDKTAPPEAFLSTALELRGICREAGALFIVNDRIDAALAVKADGVHLGQDDAGPREARKVLGPSAVIGISVRSVEEAVEAERAGADYIAANMVFSTSTKTDLPGPLGIESVGELKRAVSLPLVAIGGITAENAPLVRAAGADGIAVVSAIMAAPDVAAAVRLLGT